MATPNDIVQIINVLCVSFPNFKPANLEMTTEIYYKTLGDIPADELKTAVLHCVTEAGRAFAPTVGEIRGAVADIRRATANVPSAYEAWQEVCRQIGAVGSYGRPEFSSLLIQRTVNSLGWRNLCMSENQVADRARFLQAYEQLAERAIREEMLLPEVRGYIEARGGHLLGSPLEEIKQLAEGMTK